MSSRLLGVMSGIPGRAIVAQGSTRTQASVAKVGRTLPQRHQRVRSWGYADPGVIEASRVTVAEIPMRIFLSYAFRHEKFVRQVNHYLAVQIGVETYCLSKDDRAGSSDHVNDALAKSDAVVIFLGGEVGATQRHDALATADKSKRALVNLPGANDVGQRQLECSDLNQIRVTDTDEAAAERCARRLAKLLDIDWIPWDEIPESYLFDYEKHMIDAYAQDKALDPACPQKWPEVPREFEPWTDNLVPEDDIGGYREEGSAILVDARAAKPDSSERRALTFLEAGPRRRLSFPRPGHKLTVGVLVSGGIAPGINAVIAGIVTRHALYEKAQSGEPPKVLGYLEGLKALLREGTTYKELHAENVSGVAHEGGSILGTSRAEELLDSDPRLRESHVNTALARLRADRVDILYVIGGDGSMRAAHSLWKTAQVRGMKLSVVAVPKTMDNDVLWVWQSFGFLSAVDRAREAIFHLSTEIHANPRVCVIQLFGSDSGFVVSHAALASGAGTCDVALIPEMPFSMEKVSQYMRKRLRDRYKPGEGGERPYGMIVMAETAIPTDVERYLNDHDVALSEDEKLAIRSFLGSDRRVRGQTPDELRTGGLKVVSRVLQRDIRQNPHTYWQSFRVFTNEPRHLLRAIPPSVSDVTFAERLGTLAVDNAMAGYTDFMVSQWLTEYVLVPLRLVRQRVGEERPRLRPIVADAARNAGGCGQPGAPPVIEAEHQRDIESAGQIARGCAQQPIGRGRTALRLPLEAGEAADQQLVQVGIAGQDGLAPRPRQ